MCDTMELDDYANSDSIKSESWHWYVLVGYPAVSLLGIVSLGRLTGSVLNLSLGSVALLIILTAFGLVSLPALRADIAFVRAESDEWQPEPQTYVDAALAAPLLLGVLGALAVGFDLALAMILFSFPIATIAVCVVYLYNRHQAIGLLTR